MRVLAIGDLVGENGVKKLKETLPKIREQEKIDFVIVNAENSAGGMGITTKIFNELKEMKVDAITMGNHTWGKKDIFSFADDPKLLRPANYAPNVPGHGYGIFDCKGKKICVVNLIGRTDMNVLSENPLLKMNDVYNFGLSCRSNRRKNCNGILFRWQNNGYVWNTYTCSNSR